MKNKVLQSTYAGIIFSTGCFLNVANAGLMTYTNTDGSDIFEVPFGVSEIRVLTIGGGGGGANGHQGGGGSGYLSTGIFNVNAFDSFSILVGKGGTGALTGTNTIVGNSAGGESSFGVLLNSFGGGTVTAINGGGHNGSSGGGAACNGGSIGGAGGSGGSDGQRCVSGSSVSSGLGQGDYSALLSIFTESVFSAGAGGLGGTGTNAGGGGAGGVLIDGAGITASDGIMSWSGKGGVGYGAGGGAGSFDWGILGNDGGRWAGGNGADGLVYVEWDSPSIDVPEPSTLAIFALGMIGLASRRFKKKN